MAAETVPLRVLVVDDNRDAADTLGTMLQLFGHTTAVAYNSTDGLRLAAETNPHLAILDIGLPDLDGYELARRLRQSSPATMLVALTGYGSPADRRRAHEAGFHEHFVKPIVLNDLQSVLARVSAPPPTPG